MKTNVLPYCGKDHDGVAFFDCPACAEWLASNNLDLQAKVRELEINLAEAERKHTMCDEASILRTQERNAALAEMRSAASDALNTFEINEVLKKELTQARAEAEALRAALQQIETHARWGEGQLSLWAVWKMADTALFKARLAPAPVCSCPYRSARSGRCTNCGMPVRKPAPETAKCVWITASAGPWCRTHNRYDVHGATVKAVGPEAKEATAGSTPAPAAENAPCPGVDPGGEHQDGLDHCSCLNGDHCPKCPDAPPLGEVR